MRDDHAQKLEAVVRQLLAHRSRGAGRPLSLKKKAVSHQVPKRHDKARTDDQLDVTELDAILEIDVERRTCTAEPGVTFEDLVAATLPLGLVPVVVPELKTITIGGAVSGCSIESMSFRYGGFHDACLEYEVITAAGEVLTCTPDNEHNLVFQMMHGSFGTLGILSRLTFRLVPAKPYVHVTYHAYATLPEYKAAIVRHFEAQDVDFLDGIIHASDKYVLSLGTFVDEAPYTHRYDWMKVYYRTTATRQEDYLETTNYLFRYDRGVTNPTPKSALARLLFGKLMSSARLLRLASVAHRLLPAERPPVTLDMFLPISKLDAFFDWYQREISYCPLWVVPYRRVHDYEWLAPAFYEGLKDDLFIDIAMYGMEQPPGRNVYKEIEDHLPRFNGLKTLISYNYYDEDAFWQVWNRPNYLAVKQITDPDNAFRDLYSKTCRAPRGLPDTAGAALPRSPDAAPPVAAE
ncbi:MAG TPA: FAD-binding oxidoreductase [Labilithrix sp.]|nr:FAD-binding oxidoreductase [Labilithrix sp.]